MTFPQSRDFFSIFLSATPGENFNPEESGWDGFIFRSFNLSFSKTHPIPFSKEHKGQKQGPATAE